MMNCGELFALGPVIAVLTIDDADDAAAIAEALAAGGVRAMEVTLRTDAALDAIRRMAGVENAFVGAGTVIAPSDAERAVEAGARFLVSPGFSEALVRSAEALRTPILPGVATATEIMRALDAGVSRLKFFPAEAAGGAPSVKAFTGPFPNVKFCPTGGLTLENAPTYLALENVACIGGSWLAPREVVKSKNWGEIVRRATAASALSH